jgi:hypothetical protein
MKIFYAASTNGFYNDEMHHTLPDDAIEITEERHEELFNGQQNGNQITADENGHPVLIPRVIDPLISERRRVSQLRKLLADSDFKTLPDYDGEMGNIILERRSWRNELRSILIKLGEA